MLHYKLGQLKLQRILCMYETYNGKEEKEEVEIKEAFAFCGKVEIVLMAITVDSSTKAMEVLIRMLLKKKHQSVLNLKKENVKKVMHARFDTSEHQKKIVTNVKQLQLY